MNRTKAARWVIGAIAGTVAASVLTISSGSKIAAFDVVQDDYDGIPGAGQVLPVSGIEPGIRLEIGGVEAGAFVKIPIVLNVAPSGLSGYLIEVVLDDPSIALISGIEAPDLGLTSSSFQSASTVRFAAVDIYRAVEAQAAEISIALVEIQGLSRGTTGVSVAVMKMDDDYGQAIRLQAFSGTITVR